MPIIFKKVNTETSLEYSMTVKLLTEQHLEFLSLKGGCTGLSESTLVKMPNCWKSHVATRLSVGERGSCSVVSVGVKVLVSICSYV